ncbi:MAG: response regulator [Gammaproteobacteria bacterium]|nr:response regulator [Gammaproteobacteria bacterium]
MIGKTEIKVMLVDDHVLVRTGIRRLIEDVEHIRVVGEAESGEEALVLYKSLQPDVVLLDISMPGIGGIEATRRIIKHDEKAGIIVLSVHAEKAFPKRLLEAGAKGYLTKGCNVEEIIDAINTVSRGENYLSPSIAQSLALTLIPGNSASPVDALSRREFQVMTMIAQGLGNQKISDSLCLSPKTISTYRVRLLDKLGVSSEAELVKFAIDNGIVDSQDQQ